MSKIADDKEPIVMSGEAWTDKLLELIESLPKEQQENWQKLAVFARSASATKPSAKWLNQGEPLLKDIGFENFNNFFRQVIPLFNKPATRRLAKDEYGTIFPWYVADDNGNLVDFYDLSIDVRKELQVYKELNGKYRGVGYWFNLEQFNPYNSLTLKGFLWCVLVSDPTGDTLAHSVAKVVEGSLKKVAGVGVKEIKLANTGIYVLSQMTNESALTALVFLDTTVTFKTTLKQIKKALDEVAARLNMSRDDLLEIGVPTFGLQSVGERAEQWGETDVKLAICDTGTELIFSKNGKVLKSAPAEVKQNFAEDLKKLKADQKDLDKNLSAIATRLDNLMISQKTWQGDVWQNRYLNHVLTGTIARRLLWVIDDTIAFFDIKTEEMLTLEDKTVDVNSNSVVKLFHPIDFDVATVLAWRDKLFAKGVKQPFKQAWREIYVLTDAERNTDFYSNRFAGHILKQHQFNQLASLRGWHVRLRMCVDGMAEAPHRNLEEYGLRAEYWVEGIGDEYGVDTTDAGAFLRVRTDQLRFYPMDSRVNSAHVSGGNYSNRGWEDAEAETALSLDTIPAKVLSEIMRDVDLFVGVASIGNDPTWADGGAEGAFSDYWQSYSFGDLTETAKSRAEYLKLIIPRLKIADKLKLDGKFLIVEGKKRAYKIHLGSGNILMMPNDQYLCIIPSNKKTTDIQLEFSGDRIFSLILSKAMLLADDDKITDSVILQQINR